MSHKISAKKAAIVTGGAGFLGSHLADRLLAEGYRVIAVDNLITGSPHNIAHLADNEDFRFIRQESANLFLYPVKLITYFTLPHRRARSITWNCQFRL